MLPCLLYSLVVKMDLLLWRRRKGRRRGHWRVDDTFTFRVPVLWLSPVQWFSAYGAFVGRLANPGNIFVFPNFEIAAGSSGRGQDYCSFF